MRDIDAGTSIKFTDTEWAGNNLTQGEGALEWLASSNMTAGTVVRIESTSDASDPAFPTATIGNVATTTDGSFFLVVSVRVLLVIRSLRIKEPQAVC